MARGKKVVTNGAKPVAKERRPLDFMDTNLCEFDCTLWEDPVTEFVRVRNYPEPVCRTTFSAFCRSGFNGSNRGANLHGVAWGAHGQFMADMVRKGYRIHIHGRLIGMIQREVKNDRCVIEAMFDIRRTLIVSVPDPTKENPLTEENFDPNVYVSDKAALLSEPTDPSSLES